MEGVHSTPNSYIGTAEFVAPELLDVTAMTEGKEYDGQVRGSLTLFRSVKRCCPGRSAFSWGRQRIAHFRSYLGNSKPGPSSGLRAGVSFIGPHSTPIHLL